MCGENPNVLPEIAIGAVPALRGRGTAHSSCAPSVTIMILGTRFCALRIVLCLVVLGAARHVAADTITLEWDPSTEPVGYKVHVGVQSGTYTQHFDVGSATLFNYTSAAAGQRYCFTVSAYLLSSQLEGPISSEVCGYSNQPPTLANPGNRNSTVGVAITGLQLQGSDPDLQPLTYTATGLPTGLSIQQSTGFISGTGITAGTYSVTARASDGVLTASQTFTWTMTAAADTTLPTISITSPTANPTFTATAASITLGGTAADNVGVTQVRWASDRGGSGVASGTTSWSTSAIPLLSGVNVITVTAVDAAGNPGTDSLTVTYTAPDTTKPTISITSPTSGATYSTSPITVTGTASDNVGLNKVTWSNGASSGNAVGTTSWSANSIPLVSGANTITVTAFDTAGNTQTASLTVNYTPAPPTDTTVPSVAISAPTSNTTYSTTTASLALSGTAQDNVHVKKVSWASNKAGAGDATGTTTWSTPTIPLVAGSNVITITAEDDAGNKSTDTLTVSYSAPQAPGTVTLTADPRKAAKWRSTRLSWANAPWTAVDVYRNDLKVTSVPNTGSYTDPVWSKGTYTYKICDKAAPTACSNTITVFF